MWATENGLPLDKVVLLLMFFLLQKKKRCFIVKTARFWEQSLKGDFWKARICHLVKYIELGILIIM